MVLFAFSDSLHNLNIKLPFRDFFFPLVSSVHTNVEHMYAYMLTDHVYLEITHSYLSASRFMYSATSFDTLTDVPVHDIFLSYGLLKISRFF